MNTRRWPLAAAVLFAGYAATIAGANWASTLCPSVAVAGLQIPAGAFFAGLAFTVRDLLQDAVGTRTTLLAIALGAALSGLVASPRIALASAAAFAVSELADLAAYTPLRQRNRLAAVGLSNAIGLLVDSLLFLPLAFGSLTYLSGHIAGKTATTVLAVAVLTGTRAHRRAVPA
ncbi:VUT family protein [Kibdelosporangium philippinense]|uniref:VUT family protein n=1 Tax=Kibdelosporangium philippinense TaxID=211113 RepID=A0ABS8ZVE5_9PSEU|nr:VUT family protein [Kibdelosporangium philippinense]MCE7011671.1 VUT family protein [Kibdelosporangium philippinense]